MEWVRDEANVLAVSPRPCKKMTVCVWGAEGGIVMKGRSIVKIEKEMVCFGEIVSFLRCSPV